MIIKYIMDKISLIHKSLKNVLNSQNTNNNLYNIAPDFPIETIKTIPNNLKQFNIIGGSGDNYISKECKKLYYSGNLKRIDMKKIINILKYN